MEILHYLFIYYYRPCNSTFLSVKVYKSNWTACYWDEMHKVHDNYNRSLSKEIIFWSIVVSIVSCVKSSVSYQRIVRVHESYDTVCIIWIISYRKIVRIVRYIDKCFKMRFFVKICTFIWILQVVRLVLNTKLLGYLI